MGSLDKGKCEYSFFGVRVHLPGKLLGPWIFAIGAAGRKDRSGPNFQCPSGSC